MPGPAKKSVSKGSRCNNTAAIQNAINIMNGGKNNLTIDGIFGDNTESAVKTFQRACGLFDDGAVGNLTGGRLFEVVTVTQTLTLSLPDDAFAFTGKSPPLPPLLDTAGKLLTRRNEIQAWTALPRLEKTGIDIPKLELRHIGLKTATMAAHAVIPTVLKKPLAFLEKLDGTLPHSVQITGSTKNMRNLSISYSIDKIVQPRSPKFFSPYFKMEGETHFDQQNLKLSASWKTTVAVATPTLVIADWLEAGINANLWASANGAIGMGGAAGQASAGANIEGKAVVHVLKSETPIGPFQRTQIDVWGGFNLGVSTHITADQGGVTANIIPPKLGPTLGIDLTLTRF